MTDEEKAGFDPFSSRLTEESATTDNETLTHLLKAALGTGILSMPIAFYYTGLSLGIALTIFASIICTHCAYILVQSAHRLYYKERRTKMGYAEVIYITFSKGPSSIQKCAGTLRFIVLFLLFLTYFGTCSVYTVIVAKNFQQVIEHYTKETYNDRLLIAALLVPLILITWIPNLKKLAPVSMLANILMCIGLCITIYYLVIDIPPMSERDQFRFNQLPEFFSITIFALEAIGVILPLENSMRTPTHFIGLFGVLVQGMTGVTTLLILLGFFGYLKYGVDTEGSITLNLPVNDFPAQLVKILISLGVFCTTALQFTVCLEIVWDAVKDRCTEKPMFYNYVVRTLMMLAAVGLALLVPTIAPFMGLIGAFCFSVLGLVMPAIVETVLDIETGFGPLNISLWKNIFIVIFGILALIFGTHSSMKDIMKLYE